MSSDERRHDVQHNMTGLEQWRRTQAWGDAVRYARDQVDAAATEIADLAETFFRGTLAEAADARPLMEAACQRRRAAKERLAHLLAERPL